MNKILHIATIILIAFSNMSSCVYSQFYTNQQSYGPQGGYSYGKQGGYGYGQQGGYGYGQQGGAYGYNNNPYAQMQQNIFYQAQTANMIASTTANLFGGLAGMGKSLYKNFTKSDAQVAAEVAAEKKQANARTFAYSEAYTKTMALNEDSADRDFQEAQKKIQHASTLQMNMSYLNDIFNEKKAQQQAKSAARTKENREMVVGAAKWLWGNRNEFNKYKNEFNK